jgi:hypothetical protein
MYSGQYAPGRGIDPSLGPVPVHTSHNVHKGQTSMPPGVFETAIPAGERPPVSVYMYSSLFGVPSLF